MELTTPMKIRIAVVCAIGAGIIGFGAFGFVRPETPMNALTMFSGNISVMDAVVCAFLAFLSGFLAYLAAYPYGKQLAGLAVPVGLAVWAFRSGTMASLMQINKSVSLRGQIYSKFQLESILWLSVVAAGFAGLFAAKTFFKLKEAQTLDDVTPETRKSQAINIAAAIVITVVITHFAIGIFAQDVRQFDISGELGYVIGQPSTGQIAFAVILSFAIAAFVAKYYLSVSYYYVIISSVLLMVWTARAYGNPDILEHMVNYWPANFFARSTCAILPFQMISFAAIGSIAGYWAAVQWTHSKKDAAKTIAAAV